MHSRPSSLSPSGSREAPCLANLLADGPVANPSKQPVTSGEQVRDQSKDRDRCQCDADQRKKLEGALGELDEAVSNDIDSLGRVLDRIDPLGRCGALTDPQERLVPGSHGEGADLGVDETRRESRNRRHEAIRSDQRHAPNLPLVTTHEAHM